MNVHHGTLATTLPLPGEEHVADRPHAFIRGGVREEKAPRDVARRIDGVEARAPAVVDDDTFGSGLDAEVLESEVLDVGRAADRDEQLVGRPGRGLAVLGAVHDLLAVLDGHLLRLDVEAQVDPLLAQLVDEQVDQLGLVLGRMRGPFCSNVTGIPSRVKPCAISTAIGPPPMLTKLAGGSVSSNRFSLVT